MKIWTVTTDDRDGTITAVHFTATDARAAAMAFCRKHWPKDAGPLTKTRRPVWPDCPSPQRAEPT